MDETARSAPGIALTAALLALSMAPTRLAATLKSDRASRADLDRMERGYYERILDRRSVGGPESARSHTPFAYGRLAVAVDDWREYVLKADLHTNHRGASWSTNALGLRDREYAASRPEKTVRLALVGDSIGAGWGVDDGSGFEPILEGELDARSRSRGGPAVELLNFAVPGHAPGQRWEDFRRADGWGLGVSMVVYQASMADPGWDERRLRALLPRGLAADAPQYLNVLTSLGVRPDLDQESYADLLKPHRREILANVYTSIVEECRRRHAFTLWVLIPRVGRPADPAERRALVSLARDSGFGATLDLADAFDGLDPAALAIAPDDHHPNAVGHARLASLLSDAFASNPSWLQAATEARR